MAPRPEAPRESVIFPFHSSLYDEDNDESDEVFGETFAFELDALEHTLDEFSKLLKEEPPQEHQVIEEEVIVKKTALLEENEPFSDLFAEEVDGLDHIFNEFTKLVGDDEDEEEQEMILRRREAHSNCNDENEVGSFTSPLVDDTNRIKGDVQDESSNKPLDAVFLMLELEDEAGEDSLHTSKSLDSIYTIRGDETKKEDQEPMVASSCMCQCDAMTPLHSLLETNNERTEISDDDTLCSIRRRYKKETVAEALLNILMFRPEQLEIDFPMLLRQLEEEGKGVSTSNISSFSKKEEDQNSYSSYIYNLTENTPPSLLTKPVQEAPTHPGTKEEPGRYEPDGGMGNEALECGKEINEISENLAGGDTAKLRDTTEILNESIDEMQQDYTASDEKEWEPSSAENVTGGSEHLDDEACIENDPAIILREECRDEIELMWDEVDDMREEFGQEEYFVEQVGGDGNEHLKGIDHRCFPNSLAMELRGDYRGDTELMQIEVHGMGQESRDGPATSTVVTPVQEPTLSEDSSTTNDESSILNSGGGRISEQSRPYKILTKFDLQEGDFRLRDDGKLMRGGVDLMAKECRDGPSTSTVEQLAISLDFEGAHPMQNTLSEHSSNLSDETSLSDVGDPISELSRPSKIFTKFDLDDEEEEEVGDFRSHDGEDCRDDIKLMWGEVDDMRQEYREDPVTSAAAKPTISLQVEDNPMEPSTLAYESSASNDNDAGDRTSIRPYKFFTKFDLDDDDEGQDGDSQLYNGAEYFAAMETPKVRNSSHHHHHQQQQNPTVFTFNNNSKCTEEYSSVGSNVWGQWPFFSPHINPEDMIIQDHPPPAVRQQEDQTPGFILQQDTDLSTLSGSFSLEFAPITRHSKVDLMPTSPDSPYLLRLLGTKPFISPPDESVELEYQCFQNQDTAETPSTLVDESRRTHSMNQSLMAIRLDNGNNGVGNQRDECAGYAHNGQEEKDRESLTNDEFIHGRRVLSPKNSSADSPPGDIVVIDKSRIEDDDGGSYSVSTFSNGSIIIWGTNYGGGKAKHGIIPAILATTHTAENNTVNRILLEHCPSSDATEMVDASKRLLNQILVGAE